MAMAKETSTTSKRMLVLATTMVTATYTVDFNTIFSDFQDIP
jgi:hypothetical protein